VFGIGRGVNHRRCAQASLIGEHAFGHTVFYGCSNHCAHKSSSCRSRGKCEFKYRAKNFWYFIEVDDKDYNSPQNVENGHEWYQGLAESTYPFDPADDHKTCNDGHSSCDEVGIDVVAGKESSSDRVGLEKSGCEDGIDEDSDTEDLGEKRPSQSFVDVVHRPAVQVPLFIGLPVVDSQCDLCCLRHHPEKRQEPHPENGTGPSH